jgi:trimeric autotransporter adhesin
MHLASRGGTRYAPATALSLLLLLSLTVTESGCGGGSSAAGAPPSTKPLTSILISPTAPTVALGQSRQLTATGVFSDGSQQDITKTVTWTSAQPSVASINQSGLASGKLVGGAKVTARSGSVTASVTLAVGAATLVSIAVTPSDLSIPKGETQQLSAVGTFSDGSQKTITDSVAWSVFPISIVSISDTGLIKGQTVGSARVIAELDSIHGTDLLTVSSVALVSISVNPQSASVPKGETQQFTAVANFSDGSQKTITDSATWSIAPTGIATVSLTGLVTAQAVGSATVTVASASVHESDPLTVSPPALVSIAVAPANSSIMLGTTEQLTATGTFSDGSTQDLTKSVAWSSANSSASIGPAGLAAANSVGSTSISATAGDLTGSTALTVEPQLLVT